MTFKETSKAVQDEIRQVLDSFDESQVNRFVQMILDSKKVCGYGAGRMGYGLRAFMMRLNHLGIPAYFINDTYIPPLGEDDLFIVSSGSGRTTSVYEYLEIAKAHNVKTVAVTGDAESPMARDADFAVVFKPSNGGLNSEDNDKKIDSIQPMTSLNEQSMFVFFDIVAVMLVKRLGIRKEDEKKFHFNIE